MTAGCRKLPKVECHILYAALNTIMMIKSRRIRWAGQLMCMRGMKNAFRVFVAKPDGKRSLARPRHRWEKILKWILGKWVG
jgi:hypothetical protein